MQIPLYCYSRNILNAALFIVKVINTFYTVKHTVAKSFHTCVFVWCVFTWELKWHCGDRLYCSDSENRTGQEEAVKESKREGEREREALRYSLATRRYLECVNSHVSGVLKHRPRYAKRGRKRQRGGGQKKTDSESSPTNAAPVTPWDNHPSCLASDWRVCGPF